MEIIWILTFDNSFVIWHNDSLTNFISQNFIQLTKLLKHTFDAGSLIVPHLKQMEMLDRMVLLQNLGKYAQYNKWKMSKPFLGFSHYGHQVYF